MDKPLEHRVIKQQRYKLIAKVVLYFIAIITVFMLFRNLMTPSLNRADLRTSIVKRGNIEATLSAGGTVVPKFEEVISSEITAQVIDVIARLGQAVKKGEPILKLDTISVNNALDSLEERIAMKENQILSKQLDTRQALNTTKSRIELLEVDLEINDTLLQRLTLLESSGATAKHDLLEAKLAVKRSRIEINQLTTSLLDKKESSEAEIAGITLEKSILEKEQKEQLRLLDSSTVKAPRDGILTWLQEQEGTSIVPGEPIARIADLSTFKVEATISDFYASQLFEGQEVVIRHAQNVINGHVKTVLPTIENGILTLLIELENPKVKGLRSNLRVDVDLITKKVNDTLTVDSGPFVNGTGIHQVFVIHEQIAHLKRVEIGLSNNKHYQVVNGLEEGDEIIISNMNNYLHLSEISIN